MGKREQDMGGGHRDRQSDKNTEYQKLCFDSSYLFCQILRPSWNSVSIALQSGISRSEAHYRMKEERDRENLEHPHTECVRPNHSCGYQSPGSCAINRQCLGLGFLSTTAAFLNSPVFFKARFTKWLINKFHHFKKYCWSTFKKLLKNDRDHLVHSPSSKKFKSIQGRWPSVGLGVYLTQFYDLGELVTWYERPLRKRQRSRNKNWKCMKPPISLTYIVMALLLIL